MDFNPATCYSLLYNQLGGDDLKGPFDNSRDAAKASLLNSFLKKWEPESDVQLDKIAKDDFLVSNEICSRYVLPESSHEYFPVLAATKAALERIFNSGIDQACILNLSDALDKGGCGPGASVGTKKTDFLHKMFASDLSVTDEGLYEYYVQNVSSSWLDAEYTRLQSYGVVVVEGSNLSTTAKNSNTNRTICTEPSLNMFFQLGIGRLIEGLLVKYHNIDISTQPLINRLLARLGSITGEFATIDLKAASDRISIALLRYLLPQRVFRTLMTARSPRTRIDNEYVELDMMSSMGNGFTFPLMTLVFATLVKAASEHAGVITHAHGPNRNYAVFGDDIICHKAAYDTVIGVLQTCGFEVNTTKSYNTGPFRESCGGDFFEGTDIRGIYLKKVRHEQDIYSVFNRLARWSVKHNIDISACLLYLRGLAKFQPVPFDESDNAGFKCPHSYLTSRKTRSDGSTKYRAFYPIPVIQEVPTDFLLENPTAVLLAHLHGSLTTSKDVVIKDSLERHIARMESQEEVHRYTLRVTADVRWKVVKKSTQSWDWIPHPGLTIRAFEELYFYLDATSNLCSVRPLNCKWLDVYYYRLDDRETLEA